MRKTAILSTLLALWLAAPAGAQETYLQDFEIEAPTDGFVEALVGAQDGAWRVALEDGAYVMENRSEPGAVRYYDFSAKGEDGRERLQGEASVTISGDFAGENAGAGLLARYDPRTRTYYAFVRTGEGVALYKRAADGFSRLMNLDGPVRDPDTDVRLSIRHVPEGTRLFVNGNAIGTVSSGDIGGNRFGLVALDRGTFRFDDFSVTIR